MLIVGQSQNADVGANGLWVSNVTGNPKTMWVHGQLAPQLVYKP